MKKRHEESDDEMDEQATTRHRLDTSPLPFPLTHLSLISLSDKRTMISSLMSKRTSKMHRIPTSLTIVLKTRDISTEVWSISERMRNG